MKRIAQRFLHGYRGFHRRTNGLATVEFALCSTLLFLVFGAIVDFGQGWCTQQTINNASREGARYAVAYLVDPAVTNAVNRKKPNSLSPSVQSYTSGLISTLNLSPTITVSGAGYTSGTSGDPVSVTVQVTRSWWLLKPLMDLYNSTWNPSGANVFSSDYTLSATTTMQVE
jgi:Flp pilus assembly protein TadG